MKNKFFATLITIGIVALMGIIIYAIIHYTRTALLFSIFISILLFTILVWMLVYEFLNK